MHNYGLMETLERRFWPKVRIGPGCWEWTASKVRGYGQIGLGRHNEKAPRAAWMLVYGEDPGEKHVCHHCDNPKCVRPSHLFLGDPAANAKDKMNKGRAVSGYRKITQEIADEIRSRYVRGTGGTNPGNATALAKEYGIHRDHVPAIVRGFRNIWNTNRRKVS